MEEGTPLERAREYIRQVENDPGISDEHRVSLDRALTLLVHEGIMHEEYRDARQQKVHQALADLEALFLKHQHAKWEEYKQKMQAELKPLMMRFGELGMRDINYCLWPLNAALKNFVMDMKVMVININGALDRLNFLVVHKYKETPLTMTYFY